MKKYFLIIGFVLAIMPTFSQIDTIAQYDTIVCNEIITNFGGGNTAKIINFLYFKWGRNTNQYTQGELVEFVTINTMFNTIYGRTMLADLGEGIITNGTAARLANMTITNGNQSDVRRFANVLTYCLPYANSGLNLSVKMNTIVKGYALKDGRELIGELVAIDVINKTAVIVTGSGDRAKPYVCNIFTIR